MRLHDRYLFRELLTPLAFCLGGFLIFWISFFFFTQVELIQEKKLDLLDTAAYCAASLPGFFVPVLPILLLLALLYALANHARHNELTALRAAGVGLWRLCAPYFAVGLVATAVYFVLNEVIVPKCDGWAAQILDRHANADKDPKNSAQGTRHFYNARAQRYWWFFAYDEASTRMQNPTVQWIRPDGSWNIVRAEQAVRTNGVWTFFEAHMWRTASLHSDLVPSGYTNVLALPGFDETPERIRLLLKFADTQTLHGSGNADIPLAELWEFRHNPGLGPEDMHAVQTKFHGRLATPWTCFVVVLVAIPFGAQSGRRNLFFGVAGSIFIGFAYFVLQRISLALGMNGQLPGWVAAWLPNLIFAVLGIALTLRVR
jgi:lipopolysaccharide export system permease protein